MGDNGIESKIRTFNQTSDEKELGLPLDAQIMLEMRVKSVKPKDSDDFVLRHEISLERVQVEPYTPMDGNPIDYIQESGVEIPKNTGTIAMVELYAKEYAQADPTQYISLMTNRGQLFARKESVEFAWENVERYVARLEEKSKKVNLKKVCPQANINITGPVSVSVSAWGKYFNRFQKNAALEVPEYFHSRMRKEGDVHKPVFSTAPQQIALLTGPVIVI